MQLISFTVKNFRSVNDSGPIKVSKLSALVGRNESGKTNLLLGLHSLNPPGGPEDLSPIKDFPRGRRMSECTPDTPVVETVWALDEHEQAKLTSIFPRAKGVTHVSVGRSYKAGNRWVEFQEIDDLQFDHRTIMKKFRKLKAAVKNVAEKLEAESKTPLETAVTDAEEVVSNEATPLDWAAPTERALEALEEAISDSGAGVALSNPNAELLAEIKHHASEVIADDKANLDARKWVITLLPTFVYVDEYPELEGHQNIDEYLHRKANSQRTAPDLNFEKLCKVADLNPQQLKDLLAENDHETRNQLANRAGAVVTSEIRRLWKDRSLKVRFNPDAAHLDTLISDPNALYDIEVNLDERSRGFKWFFSFYVSFAADTKGGSAENAVLLLDEPGLYLHATSQGDLLKHLEGDFKNQVLFTTHSPFMVPTENLDAIRTVNIGQDQGTTVSNDPSGDARTLFPIQAALGFNLAQTLFVGPANLVVEGVTDYWILSSLSENLRSEGGKGLPTDLTLTPAGGAQKVTYMVALLTSERLKVMVLFDEENKARHAKDELVKQKLIREENVIFVSDAFGSAKPTEADIEDVLEPDLYSKLVSESYEAELKGKTLKMNPKIPRIVRRYEDAFGKVGLEFHKTRPARLLLNKMATDPKGIMTSVTRERFERLFKRISEQLKRHRTRGAEPFH